MRNRCLLQVLLSLSSLILSKAQDVTGSGLSCVRSSPADDGRTRVTFLRKDTVGALSLYLTLWSEDIRLVTCEVDQNPIATDKYFTLCHKGNTREEEISHKFNISSLLVPGALCALGSSGAQKFSGRARKDEKEGKSRRRRGVLFPGTLWCGTGSRARGYDQLGMFEGADRCCREHDHCKHIIPAFSTNYGVFNSKFYTISHCDCDQRFRKCLLTVNDTISSMVGYSFFNIIQVPCFELKSQKRCTETYWWGMCKAANVAPYAVFKNPLPYNSSHNASKYGDNTAIDKTSGNGDQQITESPVISTKSLKSNHRCSNPHREDSFQHRGKKGKGCKRNQNVSTVAPLQMSPITKVQTTTPRMKTELSNVSKSSTFVSNKKGARKKKSRRKETSVSATQKGQVLVNATINPYPQTASTTQSILSSTQHPAPQIHTTATSSANKTTKSKKKGHCCGLRMPLRGDAFQPHCRNCKKHKTTSHNTTVTPSTTVYRLLMKSLEDQQLEMTTERAKQDTFKNITTKSKFPAHKNGKTQKTRKSNFIWNSTHQESMDRNKGPNTPTKRGLADNHLLCGSLRHLDECRYKIPPLEKKFDLQNMESKTAYHCDCTSRLALQIKSFKQPSILSSLLKDFVSQDCFTLPEKKKCHSKKSCSGGFTKASDLLQALKKMEGKDTAGVRNSVNGRKRGFPVRLSKRCLRLQREAGIMAQLTRL